MIECRFCNLRCPDVETDIDIDMKIRLNWKNIEHGTRREYIC